MSEFPLNITSNLPVDIVRYILSYDERVAIRVNGEIIIITKLSKQDRRYILLKTIQPKDYDDEDWDEMTRVSFTIKQDEPNESEKNLTIYYYIVKPRNERIHTFGVSIDVFAKNGKFKTLEKHERAIL